MQGLQVHEPAPLDAGGVGSGACSAYYQRSLADISALADSVYVSLYKGIGGITGAILPGEEDFIAETRIWNRRAGGNLIPFYPFILAAQQAFDDNLSSITDAVGYASELAPVLATLPGVRVDPDPPQAAMLHLHLDADRDKLKQAIAGYAAEHGVIVLPNLRAVDESGNPVCEISVGRSTVAHPPEFWLHCCKPLYIVLLYTEGATMDFDSQIITGLSRLGVFLRSQDWRKAERTDLTATQAQVLSLLAARGPARVGAIAESLAVAQPTATTAIGALVRKRLAEKRTDPADARASLLHLTRAGRKKAQEISGWPEAMLAAVQELDDSERAAFLRSLTTIIRSLQRQRAVPVQRMCATCAHFRPNVHDDTRTPHHCAFVDAAFGDAQLRLDCGDHEALPEDRAVAVWLRFVNPGSANETDAPSAATDEAP